MGSLQKAISLGADGVIVRCGTCLNRRVFRAREALKLFGASVSTSAIHKLCRCKCGARATHAVANWPLRARGGSEPLPCVPKEWGRLP